MAHKVRVQVQFTEKVDELGGISYSDCLYYTQGQFANMTIADIEAAKKKRIDNWVSVIKNPPKEVEPTKEELEKEVKSLEDAKITLDEKISEIKNKINAKEKA